MKNFHKLVILFPLIIAITACAPAATVAPTIIPATATFTPFSPEVKNSPTLIYPTKTITSTRITSALPSLTNTPTLDTATPNVTATIAYAACGWVEAYQPLPDISVQLEAAIRSAINDALIFARAEAYGENCMIDPTTIGYFAAKQTDFYVTLAITDINNDEELGSLIALILPVFDRFPLDSVPGPIQGRISIAAKNEDQTRFLNFPRSRIVEVQGLTGAALISALSAQ